MIRYASRKFLLSLLVTADATVLLVMDAITAADWRAVVLGTAGVYIIGNVAQKYLAPASTTPSKAIARE